MSLKIFFICYNLNRKRKVWRMENTQSLLAREEIINPTHDIKLFAGRSNPKLAQEKRCGKPHR